VFYSIKNSFVRIVLFVNEKNDLAARMRQVRAAYGYAGHGGQKLFAEFLGISPQRWSNVENGIAQGLGSELALRLVTKCPGVTLDWLVRGDASTLSQVAMRRLGLLGEAPRASGASGGHSGEDEC
jgi:transcriptional regulator with XRE-family HTH domain